MLSDSFDYHWLKQAESFRECESEAGTEGCDGFDPTVRAVEFTLLTSRT